MNLIITTTFPPNVGGMQNLMWGLARSLSKLDMVKVFADYHEDHKKFDDKVNNFLRFAMDNFDTELVVMGIKLALTQYSLPIDPDEVECFDEFHDRFGKYITAAQQV